GKEWLCLNCQMQRAMDGMDGATKPKQGSAPPSPQHQPAGKPGKLLIKQQSTTIDPAPRSPGLGSPGASSPKIDPKTGRPIQQKGSPQPSPSPSPAKAKDKESSFFGGFSLGGLTEATKPPAKPASQPAESVTGKLFSGFGGLVDSAKPQGPAKQQEESVAGKLFGGFGGLTESSSSSTAAKLPTTSRSQMFGFGSSILNSATSLVTGGKEADSPPGSPPDSAEDSGPGSPPDSGPGSPPDSGPGSPPDSPFSTPGSPPDSDSAPDTPPAKSPRGPRSPFTEVGSEDTPEAPEVSAAPETTAAAPPPVPVAQERCPLCQAEMNVGSAEPPNYSHCSECKKTVCSLCGFNTPSQHGE
ncbi:hypothetical protein CRUP_031601, partial [Coryphaenoides rupestris]